MDTDHYLSPFFLGSAGTWQCQATHVYHFITQAQEQALRVAERTHHSLGLWPLSGPVLILSSDRRIQPESHLPLRRTPPPRVSPSRPPAGFNIPRPRPGSPVLSPFLSLTPPPGITFTMLVCYTRVLETELEV